MPDVITKAECANCHKAQSCCQEALLTIEALEAVASVYPMILEDVQGLRTRYQYLTEGTEAVLSIHRAASG